jgi:hypothetical protein
MKFLDERIIFQMQAIPNQNMILRYDVEIDQDLVFIGNVFLQKNRNISIDVTDIVKNYKDSNEPPYSISNEESYNSKEVIVKVYNKDGSLLDSATENIYFIFRRPLYDSNVTTPILDNTQTGIGYMPMLQGWLGRTGYLVPTYPIVQSDVFTFDMLANYQKSLLVQSFTNIYKDGTRGTQLFTESFAGGSFMRYSKPLSSIIISDSDTHSICDLKHLNITTFSPQNPGVRYDTIVANFDGQSRYFLKWEDRYGMPQCQPFAGTEKYSEAIKKEEITNYLNKRKVINFTVQPKWSLNSKNISEKYMPFYESIFVSPYLHLYDAKQDKLYKVVLTNTEYLEKTFRNQGNQMFNIQLEVELDTTQNITY